MSRLMVYASGYMCVGGPAERLFLEARELRITGGMVGDEPLAWEILTQARDAEQAGLLAFHFLSGA
jgi:hypothetical protein